MSWVRVWIHLVYSTKNRKPFLNSLQLREVVFQHILENAEKKGIHLESVNGFQDHMHCLISLNKTHSISETSKLIKGESSFWVNRNKLTKDKFLWQDDYWAVGVSESHVDAVRKYIQQQEMHHHKKTFMEEINECMHKNGWGFIRDDSNSKF